MSNTHERSHRNEFFFLIPKELILFHINVRIKLKDTTFSFFFFFFNTISFDVNEKNKKEKIVDQSLQDHFVYVFLKLNVA